MSSVAAAQETGAEPPEMRAYRLPSAPVVDGLVIGDDVWNGVVPATTFWQIQPNDGQPATQKTEVFVGFTDDALYIGVIAHDDNPAGIIVTDSRRDSSLEDTDAFLVIIDGLLDRQNGYVFGTNAAGIEYDGQVVKEGSGDFLAGGGGFNLNWDGTWSVRSQISETGWSTEMRIPFKTLRYGSGDQQVWGINFQRNIRRNNEVVFLGSTGAQPGYLPRVRCRISHRYRSPATTKPESYALCAWYYPERWRARRSGDRSGVWLRHQVFIDAKPDPGCHLQY